MADKPLKVFISYSWDSEEHKEWVLKLADKLSEINEVHVILDQYDIRTGKDIDHFMDNSIKEADKVLIILTPNYALRADKRTGGVGAEYSVIRSELKIEESQQIKFIPVLREGDIKSSIPVFLARLIYSDMTDDSKFEDNLRELVKDIFEIPKFPRPDKVLSLEEFLSNNK